MTVFQRSGFPLPEAVTPGARMGLGVPGFEARGKPAREQAETEARALGCQIFV